MNSAIMRLPERTEFAMSRSQLLQIRLAASLLLVLLVSVFVRFVWYPGAYFALSGVGKLLLILLAVNLVVGPGLSALVHKPGRWGHKFDLVALACIELALTGWALFELDARRPAFAVFAVDRFEAVTRAEVDAAELAASPFANAAGWGPRLVYAGLPDDVNAMNRLIDETVFQGMPDIDRRPEFWKAYPEGISTLLAAARPLARLMQREQHAAPLRRWLGRQTGEPSDFLYLPLRARSGDGIMVIDAANGLPAAALAVDPWSTGVEVQP